MGNATVETQRLAEVNGSSLYWALLALSLYAMTQPSNLFPNLSAGFGHSISPQRCSPINCFIDACFDLACIAKKAGRDIRPGDGGVVRTEAITSTTADQANIRRAIVILLIAIFVFGPLPQAIKIFATQGIPWTRAYCAIFLIAIMARAVLFLQYGHIEGASSSSLARLWDQDRHPNRATLLHLLSGLLHMIWIACLWWHMVSFVIPVGSATHDYLLATLSEALWQWMQVIHNLLTYILFSVSMVWPRFTGPIARYVPPVPLLHHPASYFILYPKYTLWATKRKSPALPLQEVRFTVPLALVALSCIALACLFQALVDWLIPIVPTQPSADIAPGTAEPPKPPPRTWDNTMKVIVFCNILRLWLFETATGKAGYGVTQARKRAAERGNSSGKPKTRSLSVTVTIIFLAIVEVVVCFMLYLFLVILLTSGTPAWFDVFELAERRMKRQIAWTASLIFMLVTATIYYLLIFDGSGTVSPDWTTYLG